MEHPGLKPGAATQVFARSKSGPLGPDYVVNGLDGSPMGGSSAPWLAAGCAPDHMHVVVRLASSVPLRELVRHLKGASTHELNHDSSSMRRFAWQDG
jgi:hypothetical protein